ncbi:MAG: hypothetical protein JETT_1941 [Candidatus Jettenia ecosi]|uniref:Uncharacterized protein n=1 Tax=Candidatus Jettenia ecosi TaxID=2494326 RepID=A0A533QAN9_9BACT|nr:MAG: hypothetical protein JETT_1941 [Candidatus Jettenia ecosi]
MYKECMVYFIEKFFDYTQEKVKQIITKPSLCSFLNKE